MGFKNVRWRFVVLGVTAAFASLLCFGVAYRSAANGVGGDFAVFWRTATVPLESVYSSDHTFPFAYPPSALPWIEPVGLVSFWPAYWLFITLSCAGFYWSARQYYSKPAVVMGLLSPPMWWALAAGQLTPLLAGAMFTAFTLPSIQRGAIVAVVLSIKPQFAFIAPLVIWSDRRAFLSMMAAGAALLLASVVLWGPETWMAWIRSLESFRDVVAQDGIARALISLPGQAHFYGLPMPPLLILTLAISVFLALSKAIEDHAVLIIGCSIFASPYAMPYDLVALTPWAIERLLRDDAGWHLIPKAALYAGVVFPVAWLLSLWPLRRTKTELNHAPSP